MQEYVITTEGLCKTVALGGQSMAILKGIDLQVRKGEFLAIMGPSGSGKSTLMGLMAGLDSASTGSIRVAGQFEGLMPVPAGGLNWTAAAGGLAAGVAIAVLSALVPVRAIRAIKPVALFRGDTGAGKMGWKAWAEALVTGLLTLAGVAWVAVTYAKSTIYGLGFLGGLLAGAGLAYGIVQAASIGLKMKLALSLAPLGISTLAGGLLAVLVGVGATIDVLQVKPLSVLRSE